MVMVVARRVEVLFHKGKELEQKSSYAVYSLRLGFYQIKYEVWLWLTKDYIDSLFQDIFHILEWWVIDS